MIEIGIENKVYSVQEYLTLEAMSKVRYEYYQGKISPMPGGTAIHNLIGTNLAAFLRQELKKSGENYFVMGDNMKVRIDAYDVIVYPDALVVFDKLEYYNNRKDILINPILVIEVLSPSTKDFDNTVKFDYYKSLDSLKEYVLVHQESASVSTYYKEDADLWRIKTIQGVEKSVFLKSLDLSIPLDEIYYQTGI